MLHGETIHSPLPQDIPWWSPDFAVFFGVLYLVLFVIGTGVGYVILRSISAHLPGRLAVATVRSTRRKVIRACLFSESRLSSPFLSSGRVFFVALLGEYFAKRG